MSDRALARRELAASSGSEALVRMAGSLRWDALGPEVRHAAKRHLVDTVGVIIAGMREDVATKLHRSLERTAPGGAVTMPGAPRATSVLDAALLGGTAGHGLELDDGYRQGSVHPGATVIPPALALACERRLSGVALLEAVVVGYEAVTAIAAACHPELRRRGFHPTSAVGVFGAALAAGWLLGLSPAGLRNAFGLAASAAGGLFAFLQGGGDVKRLHAGQAARGGLAAALYAEAGIAGPPSVLEARYGFFEAFACGGREGLTVPPQAPHRITDCYVKPYACCRHLQPAAEALFAILRDHEIEPDDIRSIEVETYAIAAAHGATGWADFAGAQLSFPYVLAVAARFGAIDLAHFKEPHRSAPELAALAQRVRVEVAPDLDALYPELRPARVRVSTGKGRYEAFAEEALGCRSLPLSDEGLSAKFVKLVAPVLDEAAARALLERLWTIERAADVSAVLEGSQGC